MRIFLSGFMAAGKTTVGRVLARQLGVPFVDLDESIERRQAASIAEIFERSGERVFRDLESRELENVAASEPGVVALGGGTVLSAQNRRLIRSCGKLVWLDTARGTILRRLRQGESTRPLYSDAVAAGSLLAARRSAYLDCDLHIRPRPEQSPGEVASQIVERLSA